MIKILMFLTIPMYNIICLLAIVGSIYLFIKAFKIEPYKSLKNAFQVTLMIVIFSSILNIINSRYNDSQINLLVDFGWLILVPMYFNLVGGFSGFILNKKEKKNEKN